MKLSAGQKKMLWLTALLVAAVCLFCLGYAVSEYAAEQSTQRYTVQGAADSEPFVRGQIEADAAEEERINLNTAGPEELQSLEGIGEKLAGRIIEYRREHGPFRYPGELMDVRGIGEKVYEQIKDKISVD